MYTSCLTYKLSKRFDKPLEKSCISCFCYYDCCNALGHHARVQRTVNSVVNSYPDGSAEIIVYRENFEVLLKECHRPEIERSRKWKEINGILYPLEDWIPLSDLQKSIDRSSRRSIDAFYGYGLSNTWDYFITLTFDIKRFDTYNDQIVKDCWSDWLENVKRTSPTIKCLVVPERHKSGKLHFHGFISNANITLEQAYFPKDYRIKHLRGKPIKSKCGDFVFNIKDWEHGYSTCCLLEPGINNRKVVNYCAKYMAKDFNVGYNKKSYYRTHNLEFKEKYCTYLEMEYKDIEKLFLNQGYERVEKPNDNIMVFRR